MARDAAVGNHCQLNQRRDSGLSARRRLLPRSAGPTGDVAAVDSLRRSAGPTGDIGLTESR